MRYWTWGEIREKIEDEFDLQEEPDILSPGELCGYLNDAIDACEQHFIKLPRYFLSAAPLTLVAGQRDYDLPDDIYATKIVKLLHECSEVKKLKDISKVGILEKLTGDHYNYLLINISGKPKIRLFPTPQSTAQLDLYYIRNANRIDEDGSDEQEVDIPEAMLWIMEYIRMEIYRKEKQETSISRSEARLTKFEQMMTDALAAHVDDENNFVEPDIELYEDHI